MLWVFCGVLVLVWTAVFVIAFCPLRAVRRRRARAVWEESESAESLSGMPPADSRRDN